MNRGEAAELQVGATGSPIVSEETEVATWQVELHNARRIVCRRTRRSPTSSSATA